MREEVQILATTHVDPHGHRLALRALESMVAQVADHYIPVINNHNYLKAPLGRIATASIVRLPDGEYALEAVNELFEPGDVPASLAGDGRRMLVGPAPSAPFKVSANLQFADSGGQALVYELAELAIPGSRPEVLLQKSLDPMALLIITFPLIAFANGFFGQMGADTYIALKRRLIAHYRHHEDRPSILELRFIGNADNRQVEIRVFIQDPTEKIMEMLLTEGISELTQLVSDTLALEPNSAQLALLLSKDHLELLYVVRNDVVPLPLPSRNRFDVT